MREFTLSAAALTVLAIALASAPANAERNWGPIRNGNQCWNASFGHGANNAGTWGYWAACPEAAAVTVAPRRHRRHSA